MGLIGGALFASWASRWLVRQLATQTFTPFLDLSTDWRMLLFMSGLTLATSVLFGTAPALHASRAAPIDALTQHGRGSSSRTQIGFVSGLVTTQVALSVVLVVGAGLFVRTYARLATMDLGFDGQDILLVTLNMQAAGIEPAQRKTVLDQVRQAVHRVPGVSEVAVSAFTPVTGGYATLDFQVEGIEPLPQPQRSMHVNFVSPDWFATYDIALLGGRDFTEADRAGAPMVAIVNQGFARRFLNGANPIGKVIRQSGNAPPREIIGVVEDAIYQSLRAEMPPTVYLPMAQAGAPVLFGFGLHLLREEES